MLRARRSLTAVALPAALLLVLGGCGTTATTKSARTFTGEAASVQDVINSFQSAARNRDNSKMCNQILAPALTAKLRDSGGGCTHVVGNQLNAVDNYDLTIESITVNGTSAQARVKSQSNGNKSHFDTLLFEKVGTSWRISGLG